MLAHLIHLPTTDNKINVRCKTDKRTWSYFCSKGLFGQLNFGEGGGLLLDVIYQAREKVFHPIFKHREQKIRHAAEIF